jgi:deazaflavin-dependent oxidoreductase (nitroreductase family)
MSETETTDTAENEETAAKWDPAAANAWEEALIADLRANGGTPSAGPLAGDPLLVLYSIGAKSGERRRSILTYTKDGGDMIVAGTAGGSTRTPSWVANLRANPDAEAMVGADTVKVHATIVDGPERDRLWDQHVAAIPRFGEYPAQVGGRIIPMVRLTRNPA